MTLKHRKLALPVGAWNSSSAIIAADNQWSVVKSNQISQIVRVPIVEPTHHTGVHHQRSVWFLKQQYCEIAALHDPCLFACCRLIHIHSQSTAWRWVDHCAALHLLSDYKLTIYHLDLWDDPLSYTIIFPTAICDQRIHSFGPLIAPNLDTDLISFCNTY